MRLKHLYIQGDEENQWFPALSWQRDMFLKAQNVGGQGGMLPLDVTLDPETHGQFRYVLTVKAGWSQYILKNLGTGKERIMMGMFLPSHSGA